MSLSPDIRKTRGRLQGNDGMDSRSMNGETFLLLPMKGRWTVSWDRSGEGPRSSFHGFLPGGQKATFPWRSE